MLLCIAARLPRLALEAFSRACSDPGYALVERASDRSIGIGLASSYQQRHARGAFSCLRPTWRCLTATYTASVVAVCAGAWLAAVDILGGPVNGMLRFSAPTNFLHWIIDQLAGRKAPTIGPFGLPTFGAILFVSTGRYPGIA